MTLATHTPDLLLLRQESSMLMVVRHLGMPFVQIYNMTETGSERTDRGHVDVRDVHREGRRTQDTHVV